MKGSVNRKQVPASTTPANTNTNTGENTPARSGSAKRNDQQGNASIEASVTRLLVATKKLLDSLTAWSKKQATEKDVSDVYVVLGNEFNLACRAFSHIGVETSDLGNVPADLRKVLERTLSQQASQATLDQYLPDIRQIVVRLLQGLRQKQGERKAVTDPGMIRSRSNELSQEDLEKVPRSASAGSASVHSRTGLPSTLDATPHTPSPPPGSAMAPSFRKSALRQSSPSYSPALSAPPSAALPKLPTLNRSDPLAALQRGDALERRASRRYSAYQAKFTGTAPPGMMPSLSESSPETRRTYMHVNGAPRPYMEDGTSPYLASPAEKISPYEGPFTPTSARLGKLEMPKDGSMTLFLQLGRSVRKVVYEGEVTIAALRLLFINRFSYSPGSDDFPQLYLQDPQTGVRFELEDMNDVMHNSVISLNIDSFDEIKRHFDERFKTQQSSLEKTMAKLGESFGEQKSALHHLVDGQTEMSSKLTEVAQRSQQASDTPMPPKLVYRPPYKTLEELSSLRRDMAALRETHVEFSQQMGRSMKDIVTRAAEDKAALSFGSVREYIEAGKTKVGSENEALLGQVDDLQDTIESLRKDVAQRGIRINPQHLESVKKDLAQARLNLGNMSTYMETERPMWKKFWERELNNVCDEQQFFNMQEQLLRDLFEDLENAATTFSLVEQCSDQQKKGKPVGKGSLLDLNAGGKEAVLSEVRALQPDHAGRVEAIERAERARQKALDERLDAFEQELGVKTEQENQKNRQASGEKEVEPASVEPTSVEPASVEPAAMEPATMEPATASVARMDANPLSTTTAATAEPDQSSSSTPSESYEDVKEEANDESEHVSTTSDDHTPKL